MPTTAASTMVETMMSKAEIYFQLAREKLEEQFRVAGSSVG